MVATAAVTQHTALLFVLVLIAFWRSAAHATAADIDRRTSSPAGSSATVVATADAARTRRYANRENLCGWSSCVCSKVAASVHVQCNFTGGSIISLNHHHYIAVAVQTLQFHLDTSTQLDIQAGFFHKNRVQRLAVNEGRQFQVATDALEGNEPNMLQIDVTGTDTVHVSARAFRNELVLNVTNAGTVLVQPEAFNGTVFRAYFGGVRDLRLDPGAFARSNESHVVVDGCKVGDVWPLLGSLKEVRFMRSTIGRIRERAFDVAQVTSVEFRGCNIESVDGEAFTEKLFSESIQFIDCDIQTIHTNAFSKTGITELHLLDNRIGHIEHHAIQPVTVLNTRIRNNTVQRVEFAWLNLLEWNNVSLDANRFGTYNRVNIAHTSNPGYCTFRHNLITAFSDDEILHFGPRQCTVHNVTFRDECVCPGRDGVVWPRKLFHNGPTDSVKSQINCAASEVLHRCYSNATHMKWTHFEETFCKNPTNQYKECADKLLQVPSMEVYGFASTGDEANDGAGKGRIRWTPLLVALTASAIGALVMLLIAAAMFGKQIGRWVRKSCGCSGDGDGSATCSEVILTRGDSCAMANGGGVATLTMRQLQRTMDADRKRFTAEDRLIIAQKLREMRGRYEDRLVDRVQEGTERLLEHGAVEQEKVAAIGCIMDTLLEMQKAGGEESVVEFVAFTDVLYKQLHSQEDPVYAEPTGEGAMMGGGGGGGGMGDHIYAEPQNAQLPLLSGDYAWPIDLNTPVYSEAYAEPHRGPGSGTIICPYAVTGTLPSTSTATPRHMPDLLPGQRTTDRRPVAVHTFQRPPPPPYTPTAQPPPPVYAAASKPRNRAAVLTTPAGRTNVTAATAAAAAVAAADDDARHHSDHSGGSDVTYRVDELLYAEIGAAGAVGGRRHAP